MKNMFNNISGVVCNFVYCMKDEAQPFATNPTLNLTIYITESEQLSRMK